MNRKVIYILLAMIAALAVIVGVAVAALYAGTDTGHKSSSSRVNLAEKSGYELLGSIPTDAILVHLPENVQAAAEFYADQTNLGWGPLASAVTPSFRLFVEGLENLSSARSIQSIKGAEAAVSFHYTGELIPLMVMSDPKGSVAASEDAQRIIALADSLKLYSSWTGSRLIVSPSDILVESAVRHQTSDASVAMAPGFAEAADFVSGRNNMFIYVGNCGKIFSTIVNGPYLRYADFFKSIGAWGAISITQNTPTRATAVGGVDYSAGVSAFMKTFASTKTGESTVATMVPAKTSYVFTIPSKDFQTYVKAYQSYADSKVGISKFLAVQKNLQDAAGLAPKTWFSELDVREAAVAAFDIAGSREQFILLRVGKEDATCKEGVNDFPYGGFTASLLGKIYKIDDESCCTYKNGWLVIGSRSGVSAYASLDLKDADLASSASFAAHSDVVNTKNLSFMFWFPVTGNAKMLRDVFQKNYESGIEAASYGNEETFVLAGVAGRNTVELTFDIAKPEPPKQKKKEVESTGIDVPAGPFTVKNTGTGKDDELMCANGRLTLTEDGVELWAVPFDGSIAGRVACVDFFQNGKLQFLFASGSNLYLYDRLGRLVEGFPVALEKPVLLGPDVYDFSKSRRYNVIVMNDDYSIDMYNIQGKKPASWAGIVAPERPESLPTYSTSGSKSFWTVRTASAEHTYPFYGGEPVTVE